MSRIASFIEILNDWFRPKEKVVYLTAAEIRRLNKEVERGWKEQQARSDEDESQRNH
jgi:hypothetical protein